MGHGPHSQNFCFVLCIVSFVSLCVFFVCKCVLYQGHRVATQLRWTNISYHIISYHIISYHIISYHIISYHISYHTISYDIITYHISYRIISYHIISYHIISYHMFTNYNVWTKFLYHPVFEWHWLIRQLNGQKTKFGVGPNISYAFHLFLLF